MLDMLAKLLKLLNSDASPGQIAGAFSLAVFVGLTPLFSLHNLLIVFLVLVIRVNLSAFFLGVAVFALLAFVLEPISLTIGEALLTAPDLQATWLQMAQSQWALLAQFNNTLVIGGFALALISFIPVLIVSRIIISVYRDRFMAWFIKLRVVQFIKASRFYKIYQALA